MTNTTHAFTESGLGKAPFKFVSVDDAGRVVAGCAHCGTGIRILCTIVSADGHTNIVGRDCIRKTGDAGLIDTVRVEKNRIAREKAQAKRNAQIDAAHAAQRERNGGLTDWEVEEKKHADRLAEEAAARQPIIDALADIAFDLKDGRGGFRDSVARDLEKGQVPTAGAINIIADIFGKAAGRRNSAAHIEEKARVLAIFEKEAK